MPVDAPLPLGIRSVVPAKTKPFGSSPFAARAGDQLTRWTIYVALALLFLTMFLVKLIQVGL